jgi:choline kinase
MSTYIEGSLIIGVPANTIASSQEKFEEKFEELYAENNEIGVFGQEYEEYETAYVGIKVLEDGIIEDRTTLSDKIELTMEKCLDIFYKPQLINTFYRY